MSAAEIVIGLLGLFVGWWVVSSLIRPRPPAASPASADAFAAPAANDSTSWHAVLGVSPLASADEIRAAYRGLVSQYHPDKVASLGTELQVLAEQKTQAINAAYREGMRLRGTNDG